LGQFLRRPFEEISVAGLLGEMFEDVMAGYGHRSTRHDLAAADVFEQREHVHEACMLRSVFA